MFEDWGDEEPVQGLRLVRQPQMSPLYDTWSLGDVLLDVWRAAAPEVAPAEGNWHQYLMARWSVDVYAPYEAQVGTLAAEAEDYVADPAPPAPPAEFSRWWEGNVLANGYYVTRPGGTPLQAVNAPQLDRAAPTPAGSGDYHLVVMPHVLQLDGRYANEPWAQETPDPMTGHVWDTWVLVHPETAAKLKVSDNHILRISLDDDEKTHIDVGVEVHPCVKRNVLAIPMGGGHTEDKGPLRRRRGSQRNAPPQGPQGPVRRHGVAANARCRERHQQPRRPAQHLRCVPPRVPARGQPHLQRLRC